MVITIVIIIIIIIIIVVVVVSSFYLIYFAMYKQRTQRWVTCFADEQANFELL